MKISLCYSSLTGHSRKIANALGEELDIVPINVKNESPDLLYADLLIVVCAIYGGKLSEEMEEYIKGIEPTGVSRVLIVLSHAGKNPPLEKISQSFSERGLEIIGKVTVTGSFLFMNFKRPNKADIEKAVEDVKNIISTI